MHRAVGRIVRVQTGTLSRAGLIRAAHVCQPAASVVMDRMSLPDIAIVATGGAQDCLARSYAVVLREIMSGESERHEFSVECRNPLKRNVRARGEMNV